MKLKEQTELNSWIADHVMNWHKVDQNSAILKGQFRVGKFGVDIRDENENLQTWIPTVNPAQAMDVLEKCAIRFCVTINHLQASKAFLIGIKNVSVTAETLPEAICLFARKVMA